MRQKRAKTYRKLMSLYSMTFGFRQPYQVLVDSELCALCVDSKIDIAKQIGTVLQGQAKLMITQCCIHELYLQGKSKQPAVDVAKTFERRKCNHREPIPGDECLTSVVGETNKHRYVIATQSQPLRVKLRSIPAVPLVHVNRTVMVLEPPSDITLRQKALVEEGALRPTTASDTALLKSGTSDSVTEPPRKKKKGPKGPNPLSVKKKKATAPAVGSRQITGRELTDVIGAKRKHQTEESDDEDGDRDEDHIDSGEEASGGGQPDEKSSQERTRRKRKRRRKANGEDGSVTALP